jgi:hypothetical protein
MANSMSGVTLKFDVAVGVFADTSINAYDNSEKPLIATLETANCGFAPNGCCCSLTALGHSVPRFPGTCRGNN